MTPNRFVLWIVCEVYYPEITSTGYYLTAIAEALAQDRTVKVICGQPNYASRGTTASRHEVHNGVEIFRAVGTRFDKNRILNRLVNMTTLGLTTLGAAIRRFQSGDNILVVTTPPALPYLISLAALVKGCSYTLLIHDAYPEQLIAVGAVGADSIIARTLDWLNRMAYKHAAKIIVVGRDMKELLERKTGCLDVPVISIGNWAESETIVPSDRSTNPLLLRLGLQDKFVLLFAGNFGRPTDVETLIEAAALMQDNKEIHFLLIGGGAKLPWVKDQIETRHLQNVTITGPLPRDQQSVFLNAGDVALVTLVPGMLGAAVPSRLYNFLAAGKPILALTEPGSEIDRIIREDGVGWAVYSREPGVLRETVERIYSERHLLAEISARASRAAVTRFSAEPALDQYRSALPK